MIVSKCNYSMLKLIRIHTDSNSHIKSVNYVKVNIQVVILHYCFTKCYHYRKLDKAHIKFCIINNFNLICIYSCTFEIVTCSVFSCVQTSTWEGASKSSLNWHTISFIPWMFPSLLIFLTGSYSLPSFEISLVSITW